MPESGCKLHKLNLWHGHQQAFSLGWDQLLCRAKDVRKLQTLLANSTFICLGELLIQFFLNLVELCFRIQCFTVNVFCTTKDCHSSILVCHSTGVLDSTDAHVAKRSKYTSVCVNPCSCNTVAFELFSFCIFKTHLVVANLSCIIRNNFYSTSTELAIFRSENQNLVADVERHHACNIKGASDATTGTASQERD